MVTRQRFPFALCVHKLPHGFNVLMHARYCFVKTPTKTVFVFRPKRSTVDYIRQLEIDIKQGFAVKQATVTIFLDIAKAYDFVWIGGLDN